LASYVRKRAYHDSFFSFHVSPEISSRLDKAYYALATAQAALGGEAEFGGLYILLAAGTSVLLQKFEIPNHQLQALDAKCTFALVACVAIGCGDLPTLVRPHLFRK
jgi:hypothetical protein